MRRSLLILALTVPACGGGRSSAPPPQRPIAAAPESTPRPAAEVCGELVSQLDKYEACMPDERKPLIHAWGERARLDFAALAHPDVAETDREATARACGKAVVAVNAAIAACPANPE